MLRRIARRVKRALLPVQEQQTKVEAAPQFDFDQFKAELEAAKGLIKAHVEQNPVLELGGAKQGEPLVAKTNKKGRFVRLSLQTKKSFHLDTIEIYNKNGVNVAKNKSTIISSCYGDDKKYNGQGALEGKKNGGSNFHTKNEQSPWLIIDLNTVRNLDKVVVYNRSGEYAARANSLMIEVSRDLKNWHCIFDNWGAVKSFNDNQRSPVVDALLFAAIREGSHANKLIKKLRADGQTEAALLLHSTINELVKDKGVALGPHGFMKTFELSSPERINKIMSSLSKVMKLLTDEFGVKAFVSSGTLLGIVRDGKLIPHDDDVDICYISQFDTEPEILEERQRMVEFLQSKGYHLRHSGIAHYWCTTPEGINLDIFTGFVEGEYCSMNPLERKGVSKSDVLPLQEKVVNGHIMLLPANPDALLKLNYGESWRVPDPLWSFNWSKSKKQYSFLY